MGSLESAAREGSHHVGAQYIAPLQSLMKRWAIFFGLFIVLIIILADTRHMGYLGRVYDFPNGDKVGHFILFGLLSFVVNLSVFEARVRSRIRSGSPL